MDGWTMGRFTAKSVKKSLPVPIRSRLLDTICTNLYAKEARNWKYMEIAPMDRRNPDNGTSGY